MPVRVGCGGAALSAVYVVVFQGHERELPEEGALWWVRGLACALGEEDRLAGLDDATVPQDTLRMQALQIGHEAGWFEYRYVRREPQ